MKLGEVVKTKQDAEAIARFFRIVRNYIKMKKLLSK